MTIALTTAQLVYKSVYYLLMVPLLFAAGLFVLFALFFIRPVYALIGYRSTEADQGEENDER